MDPFGVLLFQIIGQQISIPATRAILNRVIDQFDGHLPTPPTSSTETPPCSATPGYPPEKRRRSVRSRNSSRRRSSTIRPSRE
jgi:3-methyladenine DNA glycosylase/8-oxoguanine DNA glycosylase